MCWLLKLKKTKFCGHLSIRQTCIDARAHVLLAPVHCCTEFSPLGGSSFSKFSTFAWTLCKKNSFNMSENSVQLCTLHSAGHQQCHCHESTQTRHAVNSWVLSLSVMSAGGLKKTKNKKTAAGDRSKNTGFPIEKWLRPRHSTWWTCRLCISCRWRCPAAWGSGCLGSWELRRTRPTLQWGRGRKIDLWSNCGWTRWCVCVCVCLQMLPVPFRHCNVVVKPLVRGSRWYLSLGRPLLSATCMLIWCFFSVKRVPSQ